MVVKVTTGKQETPNMQPNALPLQTKLKAGCLVNGSKALTNLVGANSEASCV